MAVSKIDICNNALLVLGAKPIASLTEQSNNALRLNQVYGMVRDAVLRAHAWGFATTIESLGQLSGETVPGWTYLYATPSLCLKVNKVFTDIGTTNPDPTIYREVRSPTTHINAIACNDTPAYIDYTIQVDDPTLYTSDFIHSFALALASKTAFMVIGNADLGKDLMTQFLASVSEAKRNDAAGKNLDPTADESTSGYHEARG